MFNVGPGEVIIVALVLLIAVGPEQLPGVIRRAGRAVSQVRSMTEGLRDDFMAGMDEIERATDPKSWAEDTPSQTSSGPSNVRRNAIADGNARKEVDSEDEPAPTKRNAIADGNARKEGQGLEAATAGSAASTAATEAESEPAPEAGSEPAPDVASEPATSTDSVESQGTEAADGGSTADQADLATGDSSMSTDAVPPRVIDPDSLTNGSSAANDAAAGDAADGQALLAEDEADRQGSA